jgi:hypothetical protein
MNEQELIAKINEIQKERDVISKEYFDKVDDNPDFDPTRDREIEAELEGRSWATESEQHEYKHQLRILQIKRYMKTKK